MIAAIADTHTAILKYVARKTASALIDEAIANRDHISVFRPSGRRSSADST